MVDDKHMLQVVKSLNDTRLQLHRISQLVPSEKAIFHEEVNLILLESLDLIGVRSLNGIDLLSHIQSGRKELKPFWTYMIFDKIFRDFVK